jgi:phytanoyl-CoA hydroxylase
MSIAKFDCKQTLIKSAIVTEFYTHGVIYLKNYIDTYETSTILKSIENLTSKAMSDIEIKWDNKKICFFSCNKSTPFPQANDFAFEPYFLASRNASHVFFEENGSEVAINRIGHALHKENDYPALFHIINNSMIHLLKCLGYIKPVCHLSVYIPKCPKGVGSKVRPHQENTFAYTCPTSALVLWIALEDATVENACMWGIPGSNRLPLKYYSHVDKKAKKRTFKLLNNVTIPDFDTQKEHYLPLEVKKGDALLMHGNFVHCSPINHSTRSRKSISLQFIETINTIYPYFNWLWPARSDYLFDLTKAQRDIL